jgi:hypothetical protein
LQFEQATEQLSRALQLPSSFRVLSAIRTVFGSATAWRRAARFGVSPTIPRSCASMNFCANFQPPNACKFVEGHITPNGWCQLFVKKT